MFIKSIKISGNKKLWYIILGALTVAIVLIVTSFVIVTSSAKNNRSKKLYENDDVFDVTSYYAEYEVNIFSNKNNNRYRMNEWYESDNGNESFRFETSNDSLDKMTYIISNNILKLKADNQISEYDLSEYIVNKQNLLSISTFMELYKKIQNAISNNTTSKNCFKLQVENFDNKVSYNALFNGDKDECEICKEYSDILNEGIGISKLEMIIDNKTKLPTEYRIYDKNGKAYIDLIYNNFEINRGFDKKLFAF